MMELPPWIVLHMGRRHGLAPPRAGEAAFGGKHSGWAWVFDSTNLPRKDRTAFASLQRGIPSGRKRAKSKIPGPMKKEASLPRIMSAQIRLLPTRPAANACGTGKHTGWNRLKESDLPA